MLKSMKKRLLRRGFDEYYTWRLAEFTGGYVIPVDYPVTPIPRQPLGGTPHPQLWDWFDSQRAAGSRSLEMVKACLDRLGRIPALAADAHNPHWDNIWFSSLDAMVLYAFVSELRPARIIEVGSGNSTKFASRALRDGNLATRLVSIDPQPRAEIDALCTQVIRQPLEQVDLSIFDDLQAGDMLFIDSSHRLFMNSDVNVLFLEILPRLRAGVIVHVHDIFLPWDYPGEWITRYYSEQYALAIWFLGGPARSRLLISNAFVSYDQSLRQEADTLAAGTPLAFMFDPAYRYAGVLGLLGTSIWFESLPGKVNK